MTLEGGNKYFQVYYTFSTKYEHVPFNPTKGSILEKVLPGWLRAKNCDLFSFELIAKVEKYKHAWWARSDVPSDMASIMKSSLGKFIGLVKLINITFFESLKDKDFAWLVR